MQWLEERRVWRRGLEDQVDHLQEEEDHHQAWVVQVDHHQVIEDLHQVEVWAHHRDIQLIEAHHQAHQVVHHQEADHKAHHQVWEWVVLHNKALETYSETHQIL
jgi:hypothetical protein